MSGVKTVGGILALVGGACLVTGFFILIPGVLATFGSIGIVISGFISLIIGILALVGGILALVGKMSGGGLAIASAAIGIVCGILWLLQVIDYSVALTFLIRHYALSNILLTTAGFTFHLFGAPIEVYLILAGAICILASSKK